MGCVPPGRKSSLFTSFARNWNMRAGNVLAGIPLAVALLVLFQPLCSAAQQELTKSDVRMLLINSADLADVVYEELSSLQVMAAQIEPCPCPEEGTDLCSDAAAQAQAMLALLNAKNGAAKTVILSAADDYNSPLVSLPDVVKKVGVALEIINSGIANADSAADQIPESCPDDYGYDICPLARSAVTRALATVVGKYQPVKAEYGRLAGLPAPQLTPEQLEDKKKNDELLSVYPGLDEAKRMHQTIANMEQSGASASELSAAHVQLYGLEQRLQDAYDKILQNPRYKKDFWTNWDYATLKKNQGDFGAAMQLYATALSDVNVDPKAKQEFMDKQRQANRERLGLSRQPAPGDKVINSISAGMREKFNELKWSAYSTFQTAYYSALATAGSVLNDIQTFKDATRGKSLEKAAQQAGQ